MFLFDQATLSTYIKNLQIILLIFLLYRNMHLYTIQEKGKEEDTIMINTILNTTA